MRAFIDSNVVVYAFSTDRRASVALTLLDTAAAIGVQTLNEFVYASRRRGGREWAEIEQHLARLRRLFPAPVPVDLAVHEAGIRVAREHRLQLWDGMIVGAALVSGCDVLWSEDMHHGLVIEDQLRILNPFAAVH